MSAGQFEDVYTADCTLVAEASGSSLNPLMLVAWHARSPLSASLAPLPGRVRPAIRSMLRRLSGESDESDVCGDLLMDFEGC